MQGVVTEIQPIGIQSRQISELLLSVIVGTPSSNLSR